LLCQAKRPGSRFSQNIAIAATVDRISVGGSGLAMKHYFLTLRPADQLTALLINPSDQFE
jgi:hypothetical protein